MKYAKNGYLKRKVFLSSDQNISKFACGIICDGFNISLEVYNSDATSIMENILNFSTDYQFFAAKTSVLNRAKRYSGMPVEKGNMFH